MPLELSEMSYELFRKYIHEQSGIFLGDDKQTLLTSRIRSRMKQLGLSTVECYLRTIHDDISGQETIYLLDSIATNHTFFFREAKHFEVLTNQVEKLFLEGQRKFRIWCAASSSGEEPYSIAMMLNELFNRLDPRNVDCRILATDISTKVLKIARAGLYPEQRIESMPVILRDKYFSATHGRSRSWKVKPIIRDMVSFNRLNLKDIHYPMSGPFDAIFCRNVMIYFDDELRKHIVRNMENLIKNEGLLYIGMTESLMGLTERMGYVEPAVYSKESALLMA